MKKKLEMLAKYLSGGVVGSIAYFVVYILLRKNVFVEKSYVDYYVCSIAGFAINTLISYFVHKEWTFRKLEKTVALKHLRAYTKMAIKVYIVNNLLFLLTIEYIIKKNYSIKIFLFLREYIVPISGDFTAQLIVGAVLFFPTFFINKKIFTN